MILLVHPPVTKPCEPPSGISQLAGALHAHGIPYRLLDASLEGMLFLLKRPIVAADTWTGRASRNIASHLRSFKDIGLYGKLDRYKRAVLETNRLLTKSTGRDDIRISLADYEEGHLSPVKTEDLLYAAEHPEENPFYPYFSERFREIIEDTQPRFIGFSLSYLSQALCTFAMIGFVKRAYPDVEIILGGGLLTSWMKSPFWKNHFLGIVDHLVCGPGEAPLLAILGKEQPPDVHYRPVFDFEYQSEYFAPGLIMPYSASSGCYWGKCTFCPERAEGNPYIQRPPHAVALELRNLAEELNPALIHLTDNAISPTVLKCLIENPPGVPWYGFVRVTEHLTDPDFCMALKASGCAMLKLGVESADQDVLDVMSKGNDVSTTSRALKTLSNAGITTYVYLLFGTPYESEGQARKTLDFVAEHSACISFLNAAIFNLPLLSPDSQGLQRADFYEGDLSLYTDFVHPEGWGRLKVRRFFDNEFKKHPLVRSILQRQPPLFTSNHAPFFSKHFAERNP